MQIKSLQKTAALLLAFLMLFTSAGFALDIHYCKGHVKGINFFGKAESCHSLKKSCPNHPKQDIKTETNCCSNKTVKVEDFDDDYTLSPTLEFSDITIDFIASWIYITHELDMYRFAPKEEIKYKPPAVSRDIYVLLESFLL